MDWLPGAKKIDLHPGIGNGHFTEFLGVILHVNVDEHGTPASFWGDGNPGQVCPNFQVYKDGTIDQMLPMDWQPWCQIDGNFHYAAIETAGMPNEPLTNAQLHACARIVRAYHEHMGMVLRVANQPGERGLGTHKMGGAAWGGHDCPGPIRTAQRREILALARTNVVQTSDSTPSPTSGQTTDSPDIIGEIMSYYKDRADFESAMAKITTAAAQHAAAIIAEKISIIIHGDKDHPHSLDSISATLATMKGTPNA